MKSRILLVAIFLVAGLYLQSVASAATIRVEKWGDDSASCGTKSAPCLTVQYAVAERSKPNGRILVGPGMYIENVVINQNMDGQDLSGLKLESTAGMHATVIRTPFVNSHGIQVMQPNVRIGKRYKGFTVGGADTPNYAAVFINTGVFGARVEGNRAILSDTGFLLRGDKLQARYNIAEGNLNSGFVCFVCDKAILKNNQSIRNSGSGFVVSDSEAVSFSANRADANKENGILFDNQSKAFRSTDNVSEFNNFAGITHINSDASQTQGNIALINHGNGFSLAQVGLTKAPVIRNNVSIFNDDAGFGIANLLAAKFENNIALDNATGIEFVAATDLASLKLNTTYASQSGCGITNNSGGLQSYDKHFFGDPIGPDNILDADNHDGLCGADLTAGSAATKATAFRAQKASKL